MGEVYTHRHALEAFKHAALDQSGYTSDELTWSDKFLIRKLQEVRAGDIRMSLAAGSGVSEFSLQTLGCVELEEVDRSECPCVPASGCYWLKSKTPIPRPIRITSVTGVVANGDNPRFTFIKWDRFGYVPTSRTRSVREGCFWTIRDVGEGNPYLYLYGNRFLEVISVTGLWEDPMDVEAFPRCGEVNLKAKCYPLDVDFYTDSHTRDTIINKTWQILLPVRSSAGSDIQNDDTSGNNPLKTTR